MASPNNPYIQPQRHFGANATNPQFGQGIKTRSRPRKGGDGKETRNRFMMNLLAGVFGCIVVVALGLSAAAMVASVTTASFIWGAAETMLIGLAIGAPSIRAARHLIRAGDGVSYPPLLAGGLATAAVIGYSCATLLSPILKADNSPTLSTPDMLKKVFNERAMPEPKKIDMDKVANPYGLSKEALEKLATPTTVVSTPAPAPAR